MHAERVPFYYRLTSGIRITVRPSYLRERSNPLLGQFVFAYHIRIENTGEAAARLVSRHWIITDAEGKVEEVRGPGVVGEQPHLAPGESYEYTSGSHFTTAVGTMQGSYRFVADDGVDFEVPIPAFVLSATRTLH